MDSDDNWDPEITVSPGLLSEFLGIAGDVNVVQPINTLQTGDAEDRSDQQPVQPINTQPLNLQTGGAEDRSNQQTFEVGETLNLQSGDAEDRSNQQTSEETLNRETVDEDAGSTNFLKRLYNLLCMELTTNPNSLSKILKSCAKGGRFVKGPKYEVNFNKIVDTPANIVKEQHIRKMLLKKFRIWLYEKIAGGGVGATRLDEEGQGVLHLLAALGYDGPILAILNTEIIDINSLDVNQDTALDWASRMGRSSTVKLLESHGATARSARMPLPTSIPTSSASDVIPDLTQIQQMAKSQWLTPSVICEIICNHQQYTFEHHSPPTSGSLFLFDTNVHSNFRNDTLAWNKEYRGSIKFKELEVKTISAKGKENNLLTRRCYQLKKEPPSNILLVHYLEIKKRPTRNEGGQP